MCDFWHAAAMGVEEIDAMLGEGIPFETIEARIEAAALHPEFKSVLWLYAWVWQSRDAQRAVVAEMAAALR
jgi:hypothetical protein